MKIVFRRPVVLAAVLASLAVVVWWRLSSPLNVARPTLRGTAASSSAVSIGSSSSASSTLTFIFADATVAQIPDDRPDHYSFYFDRQLVGVIVLRPATTDNQNFRDWTAALGSTIKLGGARVPVTKTVAAGRPALAFETDSDGERATNLMTEFDHRPLWLQSRSDRQTLERFLQKLKRIELTKS